MIDAIRLNLSIVEDNRILFELMFKAHVEKINFQPIVEVHKERKTRSDKGSKRKRYERNLQ